MRDGLGTLREDAAAAAVYASLRAVDFSREVLQPGPERLGVLPVTGLEWNDLGSPARVAVSRARATWRLATA